MKGLLATRTYAGTYNVRMLVRTSLEERRFAAGEPRFLHVLKRVREADVVTDRARIDTSDLAPERAS